MVALASLILGAVVLLGIYIYRYRKNQFSVLRRMGVKGPDPHWFLGNYSSVTAPALHKVYRDWTKTYGKIYGYYESATIPVLVTSDPDVIQQVFLKNFSKFHKRKPFPLPFDQYKEFGQMFVANGNHWKRLRTISNPTFSTAKLKQMQTLMSSKVDVLIDALRDRAKGTSVDMTPLYQGLTMDVIAATAFGIDVNSQQDSNEPFLVHSRKLFAGLSPENMPFPLKIALLFPELRHIMIRAFVLLINVMDFPQIWLMRNLVPVIERRRKEKSSRVDLLQLMLDAEAKDEDFGEETSKLAMTADDKDTDDVQVNGGEDLELNENNGSSAGDKVNTEVTRGPHLNPGNKKLSNEEICAQSFLFLIAGYETTSTALGYATYLLALNPDKQDKLLEEIDNHLPDQEKPTYSKVMGMTYLHWVLCEALRMYPIASNAVNRMCVEDCNINGLDIPAGVSVQTDTFSLHYDPDLWGPDDPQKFVPERFRPELHNARHPMAWIPFGAGPRNCIGMRFALTEAKLALVRVLQNFTFQKSAETEVPLELCERGVITPKSGIKIKLAPRQ